MYSAGIHCAFTGITKTSFIAFWNCLLLYSALVVNAEVQLQDLVIIVLSQPTEYHQERAEIFTDHLYKQTTSQTQKPVKLDIELIHKKWPSPGSWTILPVLSDIEKEYKSKKVVMFCEEETRVNLTKLLDNLKEFGDFSEPLFLGRVLRDKEASIIHHFAFHKNPSIFAYPDFAACVVFSLPLIQHVAKELASRSPPHTDFNIDPKHELALFIWDDGKGYPLTGVNFLCAGNEDEGCATSYPNKFPDCGKPVHEDAVYFGVKTCAKFHNDRVPIVQKTWGMEAKHLDFYSEISDPDIPTLSTGIPNTDSGHCGKLEAILKRMYTNPDIGHKKWFVIADDDTILGVSQLYRLLACYKSSEPFILGERYGFGVFRQSGYNYITGGGGIVLSQQALKQLMDATDGEFCSSDDSPDDMTLGAMLRRLDIPVIHSPLFHQARPNDYSADYLNHQEPVSFHKHWMIDPHEVYKKWFSKHISTAKHTKREEL